jgi:hypothetical protein
MESWISVDTLKQLVTCELCGNEYDATRQLVNAVFHFRRSGLLGAERNAQGAVPVALTLQQLGANIDGALQSNIYSASLDLRPIQPDTLPTCEVDFVWLTIGGYPDRVSLILGECKDKGPIALNEFQRDVENLQRVADAFPARRFDTFVLFAKLSPFTADEIAAAGILNSEFCKRVILLTPRELEPYHVVDRLRDRTDITQHIWSAHQLAKLTHDLYYADPSAESK